LGDHWSRLILEDIEESSYQKCIGGNLYGAFLLSNWLNSFASNKELFDIEDNSYHYYELNDDQKEELHEIANRK